MAHGGIHRFSISDSSWYDAATMKVWLGKRNSSPEDFWKWFVANEARIRARAGDRSILMSIAKKLARVHPDLVFEYGLGNPGSDWIFEVSADGIPDRIPAVQEIVSKAPQIPGWRIAAFRQPVDLAGISLEVEGTRLELASITCQLARTEDQRLAILLHIPVNKDIPRTISRALDSLPWIPPSASMTS